MEARVDIDERRRMIAEAAYYLAEQRGFAGGDPVADWVEAEAEVDAVLRVDADALRATSDGSPRAGSEAAPRGSNHGVVETSTKAAPLRRRRSSKPK